MSSLKTLWRNLIVAAAVLQTAALLDVQAADPPSGDHLRVLTQHGYLPQVPVLVRVEVLDSGGQRDKDLWEAEAVLTANPPGVTLSTNRVYLKNGLGSALVTFSGGGDFTLTATVGSLTTNRELRTLASVPVTTVSGTLPGSSTTWTEVVNVTADVTVPTGHALTIQPNTLVLVNGVTSGTAGPKLIVNGSIQSLGTEAQPVTITCADAARRWGQIRHDNAQPSTYRYTTITRAGRAPGEGHTGQAPAIRPSNSTLVLESCNITDHADSSGTPGKIMQSFGSDVTFNDCLLARARMGPEIQGTALVCSNTWIMEMRGPDDADGIYLHDQSVGQEITLSGCVIAGGDDDAIDTLNATITVTNSIIRDWINPNEDAKGLSAFHGEVRMHRCLVANCYVGVAAKSSGPLTLVRIMQSAVTGMTRGVSAAYKDNAQAGNIDFRITNSIIRSVDAVHTDFGPTNFTITYCNLAELWPGTGNVTAEPFFAHEAAGNYHLQTGSPCIDAGDPATPPDPDATTADLGVYPYDASKIASLFVALTNPAAGTAFVAPTNITIDATTTSSTSSVVRVEFFQGATWLGEDLHTPYGMVWSNVPPGAYTLRAVVTDSGGLTATSSPVDVTVANPYGPTTNIFIALGSNWRFLDDGSNQTNAWRALSFDDSGWKEGAAPLGYGDSQYDIRTPVDYGPNSSYKHITTYFRQAFEVTDATLVQRLSLNLLRDDGAVLYINSNEVFRVSMPAGDIDFETTATTATDYSFLQEDLPSEALAALVSGTNVLAVEVHQANRTSSDLALELELSGLMAAPTNQRPIVNISSPAHGTTLAAPADVTITANAFDQDPDDAVTNVAFYVNGSKLGDDSESPYALNYSNVSAGTYTLAAVATDQIGQSTTSSVVNLTVSTDTVPPVVSDKSPAPGSRTNLTQVTVTFSKTVVGVDAWDLLVNGLPATEVNGSGSAYTFTFPQPDYGTVFIAWAPGHGIGDVFTPPHPFDAQGSGATWQYVLNDAAAPQLAELQPVSGASIRTLGSVSVTFTEPVTGVDAADLLVNSVPAILLSGSGAGPYVFRFTQPAYGLVSMSWAPGHGIADVTGNPFVAAPWTYTLDSEETGIRISEIMYHPQSENVLEEWIELYNSSPDTLNLNGFRLTDGVQFAFSNVTIPAGGYLVLAADVATFTANYPGVTNVVGNWVGFLNNRGEDIDLDDDLEQRVDSVRYADEGDWAIRQRGPLDRNHRGWIWYKEHDGLGKSLELINRDLSNNSGQNWAASLVTNGTPGRANSVLTNEIAPLILEARHFPIVPGSGDSVIISAQIVDELPGLLPVTLYHRVDAATPPPFTATPMNDEGRDGDPLAGDGVYTAVLAPQPNHTVVEYYITASDWAGRTRTWPSPAIAAADGAGPTGQVVNALYQVDDSTHTGTQPLYKIIMTENERAELASIPGISTLQGPNSQMNATWISVDGAGTALHYLVGVRNRGHGTRTANPPNYRVNFRSDDRWKGVRAINLNSRQVHIQHFGSVLARKSGLSGADSIAVQVRVNNVNRATSGSPMFGSYAANEVNNGDWAERHFPFDPDGNLYRAARDITPPDFTYRGTDKNLYTNTWFKQSNVSEDDWTDLIGMLRVVGINNEIPFTTENVRAVANVEQWMRYLAVVNLFGNSETSLNTGHNDDYYMYAGVNDPRFILMYYDLDQILGQGGSYGPTASIYSAESHNGSGQAFSRFLRWPDFLPIYHRTLKELLDTTFSAAEFNALIDQTLGGYVRQDIIGAIKIWMDQRRTYVLSVLPPVTDSRLPLAEIAGTPRSPTPLTSATLTISGADVTHYRYKLNNGSYSNERSVGTPIALSGLANGTNTVWVIGKNSADVWQEQANATVRSWVVDPAWSAVRINEVLAHNTNVMWLSEGYPDLVELYNEGSSTVDLSGLRLTDNPASPGKYTFTNGATLAAGAFLVLSESNLGFALDREGEGVYLFSRATQGNTVLDSVVFGPQLLNLSIGRVNGGDWILTVPTFGTANVAHPLGDPRQLKINEFLASAQYVEPYDFIELYNPQSLPVALGGLHLTDQPIGAPGMHPIAPLSFISSNDFRVFIADGDASQGPNHLNFRLGREQGEIGLTTVNLELIDSVIYGPQWPDISSGRCPDGALKVTSLVLPTDGAPNACPYEPPAPLTVSLLPITNAWKYNQEGVNLGTAWREPGFDDSAWSNGAALLYVEGAALPAPKNTELSLVNSNGERVITYYFRTDFNMPSNVNPSGLELRHVIDDGAVVHLNGAEAYRYNLSGDVSYGTLASSVGDASYQGWFSIPMTNLHAGVNSVAVEVHQTSTGSSDVVFGMELRALVVTNTPVLAGVLINEVLAYNASLDEADGSRPDWVEIYNPSSNAVDLAGMGLTDNSEERYRWTFPAGSLVLAQGFLKVRLDGDAPPSSTNTGFALKAEGGAVYLFYSPAEGGGPADVPFRYGLQAADWSVGRLPDGTTNWVLTQPTFGGPNIGVILGDPTLLKVNEWMADNGSGSDWFEIYNPNAQPTELTGLWLSDNLNTPKYQIPPNVLSFIGAGPYGFQRFWAADAPADGQPNLDYTGFALNASSEAVGIFSRSGTILIDGTNWTTLQPQNVSRGRFPDGSPNLTNFVATPTPGSANFVPLADVVVNEVLTHTDPPLEDAVEFYNPSGDDVNISGWYISDSPRNLLKYRIPDNTIIPAGGYVVFYEYEFNTENVADPFSFSGAKGDEVYLSESVVPGLLTGYRAYASFGPAENGVSFGRWRTSVGIDFTAMSTRTFGVDNPATTNEFEQGTGLTNSYPKVGPVVINEIMYHPASTNEALEFLELHNLLGTPVPLYDLDHPQNTWRLRKGIDLNFPMHTEIPAGGYLVIVSFDPQNDLASLAAFQSAYGTNMILIGPYSSRLANEGEAVELRKPDPPVSVPGPDFGLVPYVVVDRVSYLPVPPWPVTPNGYGDSLKRVTAAAYGNDPVNWAGGPPTPGAVNFAGTSNSPPVLAAIGDRTVNEGALLTFAATASDAEAPPQSLTYSLDAGAPNGSGIDPATGVFTWIPSEVQGPGVYTVTVRVTDSGAPVGTDWETITITVDEVNAAPVLVPIGNKVVNEGTLVTFIATATDPDVPTQTLSYSLDAGAPAAASIDAVSGLFTWTPGESDGPGTYPVTVRVTDTGSPPATDWETISIIVNEVNTAPVLDPIGDQMAVQDVLLTFTATASDADVPAQTLTYSLDADPPAGATIDPISGVFTWTPAAHQAPSTNSVTIRVTDDGTPALDDFETISITVGVPTITVELLSITNDWKYNQDGTNLDTAWRERGYDDSSWANGMALLAYETCGCLPLPILTTLSTNTGKMTFYFRTHFFLAADPAGVVLTASNLVDDGAVFHLNGVEAGRYNMNAGPVLFDTTASNSVGNATSYVVTELDTTGLVEGDNVLAVEVHQINDTSSDVVFGAALLATVPGQAPIRITQQPVGAAVDAGSPLQLSVAVSGDAPQYQWYKDTLPIPGATLATYAIAQAQTNDAGVYYVVVSNLVSQVTSDPAVVVVNPPPNTPPVLAPIGDRTVAEGSLLSFTATATDVEAPPQVLTFSLDAGAPAGASMTAGGVFSWTPGEADGPGSYPVTVRVTDDGTPAASDWETFTVVVNEVNTAPVLAAPGDRTIDELTLLTVNLSATDDDVPAQTLTYGLVSGPGGVAVDGATGVLRWTPAEDQGPDTQVIRVRVTDDGLPSLSATQSFTVVVTEVNAMPVLAAPGDRTIDELTLLTVNLSSTDEDVPAQTLTYGLVSGPGGAAVVPATGALTWAPGEEEGPGTNLFVVRVADDGSPSLSATQSFVVVVNEVNTAPVLTSISDRTVAEGTLVTFTATASDADVPAQALTFGLVPGAPPGANISAGGVFSWTPSEDQGPGTNTIGVRVFDDGSPSLSATQSFTVVVNEVNTAPVLDPIGDRMAVQGVLLTFTATASDVDMPAQTLTYSLDADPPTGAAIDPVSGVFTWTPAAQQAPSTNTVTIRVTDDGTPALDDSETISIIVARPAITVELLSLTNEWRYNDDGTNLGTVWRGPTYDDGAWPHGAALLYNENANLPGPKNTLLALVNGAGDPIITYYFRTHFFLAADPAGVVLTASNLVDDGAVFYVNGVEAGRYNMPVGAVDYATPADTAINNASTYFVTNLDTAGLREGDNVFAVEVHQRTDSSADVVFGAALLATVPGQAPITITQQPVGTAVDAGSPVQLSVAVSGDAPQYQWYKDTLPIPGATLATYAIAQAQTNDAGVYYVVVTNLVSQVTSDPAVVVVNPQPNTPPVLAPIGDRTVAEGSLLTFTATATDAEAPPQVLTFSLDAGAPAGASMTAGGVFSWTPDEADGPGSYPVTVRVTDDGTPAASDWETLTIVVEEVNRAPVVDPIGEHAITEGATLTFTVMASDPDLPSQDLTFYLPAGNPAGASIDPASGLFTYTPAAGLAPATNQFTVEVTDNGSPSLTDAASFKVVLLPPPHILPVALTNGAMTLQWGSYPGKTYWVQYVTNLTSGSWTSQGGPLTATNWTTSVILDTRNDRQRFYRVVVEE